MDSGSNSNSELVLSDELLTAFLPAKVFNHYAKEINSIDFSRDGKFMVTGSDDNAVSLYDIEIGQKLNTYYNKRYGVDLVRFTHHEKCILCASKRDNFFRIMYWSLHDNVILCSFIGHEDAIISLDVNPCTSTFVSASKDSVARVWDYNSKKSILLMTKVRTACFDNTGKVLATLYIEEKANAKNGLNNDKDSERSEKKDNKDACTKFIQ
jgi:COMPASS component SWD2